MPGSERHDDTLDVSPIEDEDSFEDLIREDSQVTLEPDSSQLWSDTTFKQVRPPAQCKYEDFMRSDFTCYPYVEPPEDTTSVEFIVERQLAHWCLVCERELEEGDELALLIGKSKITAVIRREFDSLTKEDMEKHKTEVEAAMFDELKRWQDLKVFQRRPRQECHNAVDGKWVIRWKKVTVKLPNGKTVEKKIVKARLTARGFKDWQAFSDETATFSGTASKSGQRLVNCYAANRGYTLFSMDISAAFLKGLTYEEISKMTGDPLRQVQFIMPTNTLHILRRLPGLEDFDQSVELLDFIKSMWGLKDAPRAFGMRRDISLREFGSRPTTKDPQLWIKHPNGGSESTCLMCTHIDDIKGAARDEDREQLISILKRDFGDDLKVKLKTFEFTGVHHIQDSDFTIWTHQDHYVAELSVIPLDDLDLTVPDQEVGTEYIQGFQSLLGALMWLLVTRADISPYVGYLQRNSQAPKVKHLQLINRVLRFCKRKSTGILYRKLPTVPRLVIVADSAYQSNEDKTDCIALRGWLILLTCDRTEAQQSPDFPGGAIQLIDFTSKKLQVISRSAFAAEMKRTRGCSRWHQPCCPLVRDCLWSCSSRELCRNQRRS